MKHTAYKQITLWAHYDASRDMVTCTFSQKADARSEKSKGVRLVKLTGEVPVRKPARASQGEEVR